MRDESDKHIKLKGAYLNVPVSKELNKSNEAQQFYKIGLKPADVRSEERRVGKECRL